MNEERRRLIGPPLDERMTEETRQQGRKLSVDEAVEFALRALGRTV
jgi:hypothetical protein